MSGRYRSSSGPKRRESKRPVRRYLIVSEDSKSSLDYLLSFPHDTRFVEIVPEGGAGNTLDVVQKGIELRDDAEKSGNPYVHVYCVFDKDDFADDRYHNAVQKAKSRNNVTAIWSNECFELWYLLHFEYRDSGIKRRELCKRLGKYLNEEYDKGDTTLYNKLRGKLVKGLANTRQLYDSTCAFTPRPWMENPCTNVHKLVEELIKLSEMGDLA